MSGCDVEKSLIMIGTDVLSASWSQRYSSGSDLCPSVRGKVFSLLAKDTSWACFCVYRTSHLSSWHVLVDQQRSQHQWHHRCGLVENLEAPDCKPQSLSTVLQRILGLWFCAHTHRWMKEAGLVKSSLEKSGSWGWWLFEQWGSWN